MITREKLRELQIVQIRGGKSPSMSAIVRTCVQAYQPPQGDEPEVV